MKSTERPEIFALDDVLREERATTDNHTPILRCTVGSSKCIQARMNSSGMQAGFSVGIVREWGLEGDKNRMGWALEDFLPILYLRNKEREASDILTIDTPSRVH